MNILAKIDKHEDFYVWAITLSLLIIMARYFVPEFIGNESVYATHPIKIFDHDFLRNDIFAGKISFFTITYSSLTAPLFYVFSPLNAVLIIRVLIWAFQLWALSRLAKTIGVTWWGFVLLILILINVHFRLAGEWIFGSASSKPVAYGFIFLSLNCLLNKNYRTCGIYTGLAISFHVLVGCWAALAFFFTVFFSETFKANKQNIFLFCLFALVFAIPGLLPAVYNHFLGDSSQIYLTQEIYTPQEISEIYVLFANPFHLDPFHFISKYEGIKLIIFFLAAILFAKTLFDEKTAKRLMVFTVVLELFFLSGIIARYYDVYIYLKYYPFRVADGLIPLFFWMYIVLLLQKFSYMFPKKSYLVIILVPLIITSSIYLIDWCEEKPIYREITAKTLLKKTEPLQTAYQAKQMLIKWDSHLKSKNTDYFHEMATWINENTSPDARFIVPPWEYSFHLIAKRAQIVDYKIVPVGPKLLLWKEIMEHLNRGKFNMTGKGWMLRELKKNYPQLTIEDLLEIKTKYDAEYIVTLKECNLDLPKLHENNKYVLYKL